MKPLDNLTTEILSFTDHHGQKVAHIFDAEAKSAVNTAIYAGRPLLVRGKPGVGKSQLAQAVAHCLKVPLVSRVLHARTESEELFYELDAVARLAKAQLLATTAALQGYDHAKVMAQLEVNNFIKPGPLFWAFDWKKAAELAPAREPKKPDDWTPEQGCVVLLDELDKCDSAIPNGLLEALGWGQFDGPDGAKVRCLHGLPLVIVTTNEERDLPPAFLRRCVVLFLRYNRADLLARARAHFPQASEGLLKEAADLLESSRNQVKDQDWLPGQAEYLDLLRAVLAHARTPEDQINWLHQLKKYTYHKHQDPGA